MNFSEEDFKDGTLNPFELTEKMLSDTLRLLEALDPYDKFIEFKLNMLYEVIDNIREMNQTLAASFNEFKIKEILKE